jgi:hypothetical protein
LKQAIVRYALGMHPLPGPDEQILDRIRQQESPVLAPKLSWRDHVRFFFYGNPWIFPALLASGGAFMLLMIWFVLHLSSTANLIVTCRVAPPCEGTAGAQLEQSHALIEAAKVYCNPDLLGRDSLKFWAQKKFKEFNVAQYYLAYAYFEQKNYRAASKLFDQCYAQRTTLSKYPIIGDIAALELNLLLAKLGKGASKQELLPDLNRLIRQLPEGLEIRKKAMKLRSALQNPLRFLVS